MQFTLKDYEGHKYLHYYDEKSGDSFTNVRYFVFDVTCDKFKEIMEDTDGYVYDMTIRIMKDKNLPCKSIMLCETPSNNNNDFLFQFVYLGEDNNVLHKEWNNNYYTYDYFYKKFYHCNMKTGNIFDLLKHDHMQEVTKEFGTPAAHFDIKVDGEEITTDDVLICKDLCFLKEEYIKKYREYGVSYAELHYKFDIFHPAHFVAKFVKEDGSFLQNFQACLDCKTIDDFRERFGTREEFFYIEPFDTDVSVSIIRQLSKLADHFSLKDKEKEDLEL